MPDWQAFTRAPTGIGPYADWWESNEGTYARNDQGFRSARAFAERPSPYLFADSTYGGLPAPDVDLRARLGRGLYELDDQVPVPDHAVNDGWDPDPQNDWLTPAIDLVNIPPLDPDTVIVGIIDTGIPLGHRRFRTAADETRILAAWQQTTTWNGQAYLPFGRELYATEIDGLVDAHTQAGHLDEDAFNRAAGLVEPAIPAGQRDLDRRASHGAHVLDLACGLNPGITECDPQDNEIDPERLRIIAVNLPPQFLHGPAGDFLQYYAAFGFRRIVGLADALWKRDHPGHPKGAFPIAFNLSYGMQAGPKDGSMPLERLMRDMIAARSAPQGGDGEPETFKPPLRVHMPAGNSNLYQCAAGLRLTGTEPSSLTWRIQPADQTSNHLEIWTPAFPKADLPNVTDFTIALAIPGDAPVPAGPLEVGACATFGPYARLCCFKHDVDADGDIQRLAILISIAQTATPGAGGPTTAPAGPWQVSISGPAQLDLRLYVQSDQSFVLQSPVGRRSYFDDPDYRRFWESGRPADSFGYCDGLSEPGSGPVSRFGTHNALASAPSIATIGGYRVGAGRGALYSSTGIAAPPDSDITVLYPSEDGAATFGILASGSRSGSVTGFRGTSMSTALATRDVAMAMLAHTEWNAPDLFGGTFLQSKANAFEIARPAHYCPVFGQKAGAGRVEGLRRLNRLEPGP